MRGVKSMRMSPEEINNYSKCTSFVIDPVGMFRGKPRPSGLVIHLAIEKKSYRLISILAKCIESFEDSFGSDISSENIELIIDFVNKSAGDQSLTNIEEAAKSNKNSLFDIRSIENVDEYGKKLFEKLNDTFKTASIKSVCLFPAVGLNLPSVALPEIGITIIHKNDLHLWNSFMAFNKINGNGWSFEYGKSLSDKESIFKEHDFSCWIARCEEGHSRSIVQKFKFAASLLITCAIVCKEAKRRFLYHRIIGQTNRYGVIIHKDGGVILRDFGEIVPPLSRIECQAGDIYEMRQWLQNWANLEPQKRERLSKASHYFIKGIAENATDEFVWGFVALDALFGVKMKSEATIVKGVISLIKEEDIRTKIEELYDLRCDILHGGIRTLEEWSKNSSYYKKFQEWPNSGLRSIVSSCIYNYAKATEIFA